jgi:Tol biopolymer transport system component
MSKRLFTKKIPNRGILLAVAAVAAASGIYLVFKGQASSVGFASETETGSITAPAEITTDAGASGGKAVQFKAASGALSVYFASNRTGNYEIYKKDLTTNVITRLTQTTFDSLNPEISPDGTRLVFYSDRQNGINQIYSLSLAQPQNVTRLTNDGANDYDPAFMPDGRVVYKSNRSDGYGDIWLMNADGTSPANLTASMTTTEEWKPCPLDAKRIVFTSRQANGTAASDELYLLNLTTNISTRLTNNSVPDWFPSPNPKDPNKFLFISKAQPTDPDGIYSFNILNGQRTRISSTSLVGDIGDPSMSPDGQKIAVVQNINGGYTTMLLMDASGANAKTIDKSPTGQDLSPLLVNNK